MPRHITTHPLADLRRHPTLPGFRLARDLADPDVYWSFGQWEGAWGARKAYEISPEDFERLERLPARDGSVANWPGARQAEVVTPVRKRGKLSLRSVRIVGLVTHDENDQIIAAAEAANQTVSTWARDALLARLVGGRP